MRRDLVIRGIGALLILLIVPLAATLHAEEDARRGRAYLPLIAAAPPPPPPPITCDVPGGSYESLSVIGDPLTVNPETDPNLNLGVRGYAPTNAALKLVELGPVHDPNAPQLPGMFADRRTPAFVAAYQRYNWDDDCNCQAGTASPWEATVLGMRTNRGEVIYTPDSGYDIERGYEYLVMYASERRLTLHIGREDEFFGYVIHIEDVCIDPDLVALYRQLDAQGRQQLPALRGHQPIGRALGREIKVAVRDTGSFMDPRSRNDWWQGR